MQTPRPDVLTNFEVGQIQADTQALIDDTDVSVGVTYRSFDSETFDAETGTQTTTTTDTPTTALRAYLSAEKVDRLSGTIQELNVEVGDRVYLVDSTDISEPSTEDTITEGSVTLEVTGWRADVLGQFYWIGASEAHG